MRTTRRQKVVVGPLPDGYLTIDETARYLGISTRFIYRLMKDPTNPIPFHKIGRATRFSKAALEPWLDSLTVPRKEQSHGK